MYKNIKKEITNLVKKYYQFPPIINLRKNRFKINDNYDNIYQKSLFNKLPNYFKYKSGYTFFKRYNFNYLTKNQFLICIFHFQFYLVIYFSI